MKISYSLTFKEFYRASLRRLLTILRVIPWLGCFAVLILVTMCAPLVGFIYLRFIAKIPMPGFTTEHAFFIFTGLALEFPAIFSLMMLMLWPLVRRTQLEIGPEGVVIGHRKTKTTTPWRDVLTLEEDGLSLFISAKATWKRSMLCVTVPKRVFSSPDEAQTFFRQAEIYWDIAIIGRPTQTEGFWPPAPTTGQQGKAEP